MGEKPLRPALPERIGDGHRDQRGREEHQENGGERARRVPDDRGHAEAEQADEDEVEHAAEGGP
jgi:hypothetical protein